MVTEKLHTIFVFSPAISVSLCAAIVENNVVRQLEKFPKGSVVILETVKMTSRPISTPMLPLLPYLERWHGLSA